MTTLQVESTITSITKQHAVLKMPTKTTRIMVDRVAIINTMTRYIDESNPM